MLDLTARRESRQPLDMPGAGSTFKSPKGHFAGTLIDKAGLKGLRVGGVTSEDVLALIEEVKRRVLEAHGVTLSPEVRIIGKE